MSYYPEDIVKYKDKKRSKAPEKSSNGYKKPKKKPKVKVTVTFIGNPKSVLAYLCEKPLIKEFNSLSEASWWVGKEKRSRGGKNFKYEIEDEICSEKFLIQ